MTDTLTAHLNRYFALNTRIRSDQTRKIYHLALANLGEFIGRPPTLEDLTDDNIAGTMGLLIGKKKSPYTVNERRSRLHAFWKWLASRGIVSHWPTTPNMPEPRRTPTAWGRAELERLFAACHAQSGWIEGLRESQWWLSLHLVCWDSGERISALLSCRWSFLRDDWLVIPAENRKGKQEDGVYRLHQRTLEYLDSFRTDRELIWPWPYHETYFFTRYKKLRKQHDLPDDRAHGMHCLRRSVASYFEAAGGDATALLGHSARRVTKAYLDPRIVQPKQAIDLLFRPEKQ